MRNKIKNIQPHSYVQGRDFYWVAEYLNGTLLPEYRPEDGQKNDFYEINKLMLLNFGYLGCGIRLYFDTITGIFNIGDNEYSFEYVVNDKVYCLTNQMNRYNDIISYKSMYSDANWNGQSLGNSGVSQYHFGYKNIFKIEDINFHFKPIVHIPLDKPANITIGLVSDKTLNGKIVIKKNGFKCKEFDAPLDANVGGELTWVIEL